MELTDEEKRVILERRKAKEQAEKRELDTRHLLNTAFRFLYWLDENGAGATFSTFCDDFEYEAKEGEDRSRLYKNVMEVIGVARGLTR